MVYPDKYNGEDGTYFDVGEGFVILHKLHAALEQEEEIEAEEEKKEERKDQLRRKDIKRLRKKAKEECSRARSQQWYRNCQDVPQNDLNFYDKANLPKILSQI